MPHTPSQDTNDKKVSVEELLRLKRAERPNEAFWGRFDQELHQRMLQTLVKKDPWYVQVMRGFSGRFAQTLAVGSAAVFAALLMLRPGAAPSPASVAVESSLVQDESTQIASVVVPGDIANGDLSYKDASRRAQSRDYGTDSITANANFQDTGFRREFEMDRIQFASFEGVAYSEASATRGSYSTPGAVSLVY